MRNPLLFIRKRSNTRLWTIRYSPLHDSSHMSIDEPTIVEKYELTWFVNLYKKAFSITWLFPLRRLTNLMFDWVVAFPSMFSVSVHRLFPFLCVTHPHRREEKDFYLFVVARKGRLITMKRPWRNRWYMRLLVINLTNLGCITDILITFHGASFNFFYAINFSSSSPPYTIIHLNWVFKCSTIFTLTSTGTAVRATGTNSATNWSNVTGWIPIFRRIASLAASWITFRHPHSVRLAWRWWWIRSISPDDSSLWRMADSICCCCCCCWPSWGHGL